MTEELPAQPDSDLHAVEPVEPAEPAAAAATGVPTVDSVLADLEQLDQLPLDEHLAVFERTHGSLRAALDADPDESS
jgi:hypothetical protein